MRKRQVQSLALAFVAFVAFTFVVALINSKQYYSNNNSKQIIPKRSNL